MNKRNFIIYAVIMIVLIVLMIVFQGVNDMITMTLFALAIIITSIYTYGNRRTK